MSATATTEADSPTKVDPGAGDDSQTTKEPSVEELFPREGADGSDGQDATGQDDADGQDADSKSTQTPEELERLRRKAQKRADRANEKATNLEKRLGELSAQLQTVQGRSQGITDEGVELLRRIDDLRRSDPQKAEELLKDIDPNLTAGGKHIILAAAAEAERKIQPVLAKITKIQNELKGERYFNADVRQLHRLGFDFNDEDSTAPTYKLSKQLKYAVQSGSYDSMHDAYREEVLPRLKAPPKQGQDKAATAAGATARGTSRPAGGTPKKLTPAEREKAADDAAIAELGKTRAA